MELEPKMSKLILGVSLQNFLRFLTKFYPSFLSPLSCVTVDQGKEKRETCPHKGHRVTGMHLSPLPPASLVLASVIGRLSKVELLNMGSIHGPSKFPSVAPSRSVKFYVCAHPYKCTCAFFWLVEPLASPVLSQPTVTLNRSFTARGMFHC